MINFRIMKWINAELLGGLSLFLLGFLFYLAGLVNKVWETIVVVDYIIMAIGIGVIALGIWTAKNEKNTIHTSHH